MDSLEIYESQEPSIFNYIGLYLYCLMLLSSALIVMVLLNNYIEYDYYMLNNNVKTLLFNINDKFEIFSNKDIDTMNIKKMTKKLEKISNRDIIVSSADEDFEEKIVLL